MPHQKPRRSGPSWKKWLLGCAIGCGSLLVIIVGVALILFLKLTAVPPGAELPSASRPPTAATARPEPPPYDVQRQQIEQAARTGQPTAVTLRLSEAQINELIQQNADANAPLRDVRVTLGQSDITFTGVGYWRGRPVYVTATARPSALNGRPHLELYGVRVGTLNLPGRAVAQLQAQLDRAMADWAAKNPYDVTEVSVYDGQIVISGTTRPR